MSRTLLQGMNGDDVAEVQDVLNFHIRRGAPLVVDSKFGHETDTRVREFQRVNGLVVDGKVGNNTRALLFEVTEVTLPILLTPNLQLTLPTLGARRGIQPPRLIPPLQWPGPPLPAPAPFKLRGAFTLDQNSTTTLPDLPGPANAIGLTATLPTRKDPDDPNVRSRKTIVELINDLGVNSKFKALLLSQLPNTVQKISPPDSGFKWGLAPLFDPLDPKGFGVKGNAQFSVRLTDGLNGLPNMVLGAWGDGMFSLDFSGRKGESRPKVLLSGTIFFALKGTFGGP